MLMIKKHLPNIKNGFETWLLILNIVLALLTFLNIPISLICFLTYLQFKARLLLKIQLFRRNL